MILLCPKLLQDCRTIENQENQEKIRAFAKFSGKLKFLNL